MAEKQFIDGIFNYCDRWCERCAFTDRCRTYAMEQQFQRELRRREETDEPPPVYSWEKYDAAAEQIKPWLAAQREKFTRDMDREEQRLREQPLVRRADAYRQAADEWFAHHPVEDSADARIADAVAVIRWYQFFIMVKLMRASDTDLMEEDEDEGMDEEIREAIDQADRDDNNGTAKVALIAMDRSIAAWAMLGEAGQEETEPLIHQLDALRQVTEQVFPNARDFIRPGLDWPDLEQSK